MTKKLNKQGSTALTEPRPADRHPVAVYLAALSKGSRAGHGPNPPGRIARRAQTCLAPGPDPGRGLSAGRRSGSDSGRNAAQGPGADERRGWRAHGRLQRRSRARGCERRRIVWAAHWGRSAAVRDCQLGSYRLQPRRWAPNDSSREGP